jgi:hypothetical protein
MTSGTLGRRSWRKGQLVVALLVGSIVAIYMLQSGAGGEQQHRRGRASTSTDGIVPHEARYAAAGQPRAVADSDRGVGSIATLLSGCDAKVYHVLEPILTTRLACLTEASGLRLDHP